MLAGDYNIIPTDLLDVYKPENWADDALMQPEPQAAVSPAARRRAGPTRSASSTRSEPVYTFWDYWRNAFARDAGIRIDHLLLNPAAAKRLKAAGVDRDVRGAGKGQRPRADLGGAEGLRGQSR